MQYHLIDENKVRVYYENEIALGNAKEDSISIYGVNYEFDNKLNVIKVSATSEDAYAVTDSGLIKWKHPVEKEYSGGEKFYAKLEISSNSPYMFCYSYICLASLPSSNALKIDVNNIRFAKDSIALYKPGDVDIKVEENEDHILLELNNDTKLELGVLTGGKFYFLEDIYAVKSGSKKIIPKGTCYKTQYIRTVSKKHNLRFQALEKEQEICYF